VRGLCWVCCILLITTSAVSLVLDVGGCAKPHPAGGLSKLKSCRVAGVDEQLLCGKLTVFENRKTRTGRTIDLNIVVLPALDQKHQQIEIAGDQRQFHPLANEGSAARRQGEIAEAIPGHCPTMLVRLRRVRETPRRPFRLINC